MKKNKLPTLTPEAALFLQPARFGYYPIIPYFKLFTFERSIVSFLHWPWPLLLFTSFSVRKSKKKKRFFS